MNDGRGGGAPDACDAITPTLLRAWALPLPDEDGDKTTRGQVLVVAGSASVPGGAVLAGIAALRAGAGKLQVATVASRAGVVGVALPEALVAGLPETPAGGINPEAAGCVGEMAAEADAVLVGPGLVDPPAVSELVTRLLAATTSRSSSGPPILVLDAAAITCLERPSALSGLSGRVVLTPNRDELSTLAKATGCSADATEIACRLDAVVAVRGGVAAPDGSHWRHDDGTIGLGTSGSGDVLAGLIAGYAARGASPVQAAVWGLFVHARAGNRLAARFGRVGFLARELLDELPAAVAEVG